MLTPRRQLRRLTWVALTAMLALALLPTLSRALSFARGDGALAEICTPRGARFVAPADAPTPADALLGHLDHCPLCSLHGAALGLPPAKPRWVEPASLTHALLPPLFLTTPRPLFAWSAARPRAPPALS